MNDNGRALVEAMHREAIERYCKQALAPPVKPPTVHYTELQGAKQGEALADEWNTLRREVGRLLTEHQEGRFVLIKGREIIGIYDTWAAAREDGLQRYLLEPFLVQPIRTEEPYLRIRGINLAWPS
jgi:hypothetical protein